jgi:hypothetical protein
MVAEPLATFHRRLVGIRVDLRIGRARILGFGLVSRSRCVSDRSPGLSKFCGFFAKSATRTSRFHLSGLMRTSVMIAGPFLSVHVQSPSVPPRLRDGWLASSVNSSPACLGPGGDHYEKVLLSIFGFTVQSYRAAS